MRLAVFTICINQHVPQARVLLDTISRFLPGAARFVILADTRQPAVPYPGGCQVIAASELSIPGFIGFAFRYDAMELSAALKPYAFLHLLGRAGYTHCLYFDPDIELFSTVPAIKDALAANASFILTPQILSPATQQHGPDDITFMQGGAYNLGFLGVSGTAEARGLLAWWARRLRFLCVNDRPIGLFIDQKFMDLVPGFARNAVVLHDLGLNVGYWNLRQRRFLPDSPEGPRVDGGPLGFFHYDGFDPSRPDQLSTQTDLFRGADLPEVWRGFLSGYAERLRAAGQGTIPAGCYAYGRFASGVPIPPLVRRMFRDDHAAWAGDPFTDFEAWAHLPARNAVPSFGSAIPSLAMQWLNAREPALASRPLSKAAGSQHVTRWWLTQGEAAGIDRRFLEPQALAAGLRPLASGACRPTPSPGRPDITVVAPFGEDSPAGYAGRAQLASLRHVAGQVDETDIGAGGWRPARGRVLALCLPPCALPLSAEFKWRLPHQAYRVLIPSAASETGAGALDGIDEVWAPTRFIQAGIVLATQIPVLHMPLAWHLPPSSASAPGRRPYILAAAAGVKGPNALLAAAVRTYRAAFTRWADAERPDLVVCVEGGDAEARIVAARYNGVHVGDAADVATLTAGAACALLLHGREPLGWPVARAMAHGVPVVAIEYGGCTDLLTPETGWPVEYRLVLSSVGGVSPPWAEADTVHAAWSLREVFERPEEVARRTANASGLLRTTHGPAAIAARQAARLAALGLVAGRTA